MSKPSNDLKLFLESSSTTLKGLFISDPLEQRTKDDSYQLSDMARGSTTPKSGKGTQGKHQPPPEKKGENPKGKSTPIPPTEDVVSKHSAKKEYHGGANAADPVTALGIKLKTAKMELAADTWKQDRRAGFIDATFYTITDNFDAVDEAQAIPTDLRDLITKAWWMDKWVHLRDPPDWVTIQLFLTSVPTSAGNDEALVSLRAAEANLATARARMDGTLHTAQALVAKNLSIDSIATSSIARLTNQLVSSTTDTVNILSAMMTTIGANLAKSEAQIVNVHSVAQSGFEDHAYTLQNKMDQMTVAIEKVFKLSDTETGNVMTGQSSRAATTMRSERSSASGPASCAPSCVSSVSVPAPMAGPSGSVDGGGMVSDDE